VSQIAAIANYFYAEEFIFSKLKFIEWPWRIRAERSPWSVRFKNRALRS